MVNDMRIPNYVCKSDINNVLQEWVIGRNALRNKEIFVRKVFDGITFEAVAEEYDLTDRQVQNIVYRLTGIINSHIPEQ